MEIERRAQGHCSPWVVLPPTGICVPSVQMSLQCVLIQCLFSISSLKCTTSSPFLPLHMMLLYSAGPHFSHSFIYCVQALPSLPPSLLSFLHFLSSTADFRDRVAVYPKGLYTCYVSRGSRTHDCPSVSASRGLRIKASITCPPSS